MRKLLKRLTAVVLCLCLLGSFAVAEEAAEDAAAAANEAETVAAGESAVDPAENTEAATFVAYGTLTLKVRREPDKSSGGIDSIPVGTPVYIIELGTEWSKVDTGRRVGYVQNRYLTDIREYDATLGVSGAAATTPVSSTSETTASTSTATEGFTENFKCMTYKAATMRKEMDERSASVCKIPQYKDVVVSSNQGDWSYVRYEGQYGYVLTKSLFMWDRIDPYAGEIPGQSIQTAMVFVNHSTDIMSYDDNGKKVLKTVNPGSALGVYDLDEQGRYPLAYWRTKGYITPDDVSYVMPVVAWDEAESGDLISCMSTYYAIGVSSLQYQGRNWNIYLGTSMISGTVVQPNEEINIYKVMGPYRKSTGYHKAPIMSSSALWGYGGGTCQVNTTLYNTLIQVPIYINWRIVHAKVGIYYCPVGFDAAVGGGNINMIFTNTLPYAVRINFFMSDGVLTCAIFKM